MNFVTELREGLAISWSAIRANKLRSVLTTLGIVIGIVTVTLMGTAIEGLNGSFMSSISTIGADVLYVDQRGWLIQTREDWVKALKNPAITLDDADMVEEKMAPQGSFDMDEVNFLEREVSTAMAVAPVASDDTPVKYKKRGASSVPVVGTTDQFQFTGGLTLEKGRFLSASECDGGRPVCVIGADLATNLFEGDSPVGQIVSANQRNFQVVGVLAKQGGFADTGGADNEIIVPITQFTRVFYSQPDYEIQV